FARDSRNAAASTQLATRASARFTHMEDRMQQDRGRRETGADGAEGRAGNGRGNGNGERRAGPTRLEPEEAKRRGSVTGLLRDSVVPIGLAASSLALLAGTRGGGEKPASVAIAEGFLPPADIAEKK